MEIETIQKLLHEPFQITQHAEFRCRQRGISVGDIRKAIMNGTVIKDYPTDYPYPSCLILGFTQIDEPLHVVCGVGEGTLFVITAYRPSEIKWEMDWQTRKESEK